MTFEIPEDMAERFSAEVPADEQLRVVVTAIRRRITPRLTKSSGPPFVKRRTNDPETQQIQAEFDAIPDTFDEVWDDAPAR